MTEKESDDVPFLYIYNFLDGEDCISNLQITVTLTLTSKFFSLYQDFSRGPLTKWFSMIACSTEGTCDEERTCEEGTCDEEGTFDEEEMDVSRTILHQEIIFSLSLGD